MKSKALANIWPEFYRVAHLPGMTWPAIETGHLVKSDAHILIVDDDKGIRDLLQEFFQKRGLHTSVAADGTEMEATEHGQNYPARPTSQQMDDLMDAGRLKPEGHRYKLAPLDNN